MRVTASKASKGAMFTAHPGMPLTETSEMQACIRACAHNSPLLQGTSHHRLVCSMRKGHIASARCQADPRPWDAIAESLGHQSSAVTKGYVKGLDYAFEVCRATCSRDS